jgi:hypothetical protein
MSLQGLCDIGLPMARSARSNMAVPQSSHGGTTEFSSQRNACAPQRMAAKARLPSSAGWRRGSADHPGAVQATRLHFFASRSGRSVHLCTAPSSFRTWAREAAFRFIAADGGLSLGNLKQVAPSSSAKPAELSTVISRCSGPASLRYPCR